MKEGIKGVRLKILKQKRDGSKGSRNKERKEGITTQKNGGNRGKRDESEEVRMEEHTAKEKEGMREIRNEKIEGRKNGKTKNKERTRGKKDLYIEIASGNAKLIFHTCFLFPYFSRTGKVLKSNSSVFKRL